MQQLKLIYYIFFVYYICIITIIEYYNDIFFQIKSK